MIEIKNETSESQIEEMTLALNRAEYLFNSFGTKLEKIGYNEYKTTTRKGKTETFCGLYRVALRKDGSIQKWFC